MTKRKVHVGPHKYRKVAWGKSGTIVFRCMLPNCSHYMHPEFLEGKATVCWRCGQIFNMTKEDLDKVRPKCVDCVRRAEAEASSDRVLNNLTSLIGGGRE